MSVVPEPTIGSLFSGYGGLELAVLRLLGGRVAWHAEVEPAPSAVLDARFPGVPNLGDVTRVGLPYSDEEWKALQAQQDADPDYELPAPDWTAVEPVDVLTLGFPCQDVSGAGKRLGLRPDTRSGLWSHAAYAVSQLRPELVVIENVRGLLSAAAHGVMEPCPLCVGDGSDHPLRALGAVLGDLAGLGYDASWQVLRASDVGAPHQRARVFILAWPAADTAGSRREGGDRPSRLPGQGPNERVGVATGRGLAAADADGRRRGEPDPGLRGVPVAHEDGDDAAPPDAERGESGLGHGPPVLGRRAGDAEQARMVDRAPDGRPGGAPAADADGGEPERRGVGRVVGGAPAAAAPPREERERAGDAARDRGPDAPDSAGSGRARRGEAGEADRRPPTLGGETVDEPRDGGIAWGNYGGAVRRWEAVLGRPAPSPVEPGAQGQPRLAAPFVEWMMGLPEGWVTGVPGLSRNDMLKALGNGVVPQQACEAIRLLLPDVDSPTIDVA